MSPGVLAGRLLWVVVGMGRGKGCWLLPDQHSDHVPCSRGMQRIRLWRRGHMQVGTVCKDGF